MQRDDETPGGRPETPGGPPETPAIPQDPERARLHRRFTELVAGLRLDDPRFVRRMSPPRTGRLKAADLMIAVGLVATVLFGIVPLSVGLHLQVVALLALGAAGCVAMPVVAPLATRMVLGHARPLWT